MAEILKKRDWVPLSELPKRSEVTVAPDRDTDVLSENIDKINSILTSDEMKDMTKIMLDSILKRYTPISINPQNIFSEYPLIIDDNMHFPYNINTGKTTVDLDHIMVNQKAMKTMNDVACFRGSIMNEFRGAGSEFEDVIFGDGDKNTMVATAAKSRRVKKPDTSQRRLMFDFPSSKIWPGVGKAVVDHQLNRTAINERIDEIKQKNPNEENINDVAWATALNEHLSKSMRLSGKELLFSGSRSRTKSAVQLAGMLASTIISPVFIAVPVCMYGFDILVTRTFAEMGGGSIKDIRLSMFPPSAALYDRYIALNALTRVTKLIDYRRK
jgi:hypothetical protein